MDSRVLVDDLRQALAQLEKALNGQIDSDLERAGCIQYFEFCFELAWKAVKTMALDEGITDCNSPKSSLRYAFSRGLIDDECVWLEMLQARNRMAHTYDVDRALTVFSQLKAPFLPALQALLKRLCDAD